MTELDALQQLSELIQTIEENNWEGIYTKINSETDLPFTPRTYRQEKELFNLKQEKLGLEKENQGLRIQIGAIKNLLKDGETKS